MVKKKYGYFDNSRKIHEELVDCLNANLTIKEKFLNNGIGSLRTNFIETFNINRGNIKDYFEVYSYLDSYLEKLLNSDFSVDTLMRLSTKVQELHKERNRINRLKKAPLILRSDYWKHLMS